MCPSGLDTQVDTRIPIPETAPPGTVAACDVWAVEERVPRLIYCRPGDMTVE